MSAHDRTSVLRQPVAPQRAAAVPPRAPLPTRVPPQPLKPQSMIDARPGDHLVLMPGQLHFGKSAATVRALGLGVAITLWHPQRRLGGMCHFLLPSRRRDAGAPLEGRFGDEAVEMMVQSLTRHGTKPDEYVAHLYGGADTMPEGAKVKLNIGERNIEQGWTLIDKYGFQLDGVDVGDNVPRTVLLDYALGQVDIKRSSRI
jgi:chemotaxis protein CheD